MGRGFSADDVRDTTFKRSPLGKRGYASDDVDACVRVIADVLDSNGHLSASDVHGVIFRMSPTGERGYDVEQVDAFLAAVEDHLRAPESPADAAEIPSAASGSVPGVAPNAVVLGQAPEADGSDASWHDAAFVAGGTMTERAQARGELVSTWVPTPFTARPSRRTRLLWTPLVAFNVPVVAFAVSGFTHASPQPLSSAGVYGFFAVLVTFVAAWQTIPFVEADDSGVTVHGLTRRLHLPWSAIGDLRLVYAYGNATEGITTNRWLLTIQTPRKRVTALAPSGSPELGKPMDVLLTKLLIYREKMRRPGEPAGQVTRSVGIVREITAWAYLLMPVGLTVAYYARGGK